MVQKALVLVFDFCRLERCVHRLYRALCNLAGHCCYYASTAVRDHLLQRWCSKRVLSGCDARPVFFGLCTHRLALTEMFVKN